MNIRSARASLLALLGLLSATAFADGFVILDYAGLNDRVLTLRTANGRIHAQVLSSDAIPAIGSQAGLLATDVDGNVDAGFGQNGWLTLAGIRSGFVAEQLANDGSFDLQLRDRVQRRDSLGAILSESPPLYTSLPIANTGSRGASVFARQADGKSVIGGTYILSAMGGWNQEWTLARLEADASTLDATFGGGIVRQPFPRLGINLAASIRAIHVLANGQILATGRLQTTAFPTNFETVFMRFDSNGSVDGSFGANAQIRRADSTGLTRLDSAERIYLAESDGRVTRLSNGGVPDAGYPGGAAVAQLHVTGLELDSQERAVVFGWVVVSGEIRGYVARFDVNGSRDASFNGSGFNTVEFPLSIPAPSILEPRFPICVGAIQTADRPLIACNVVPVGDSNDSPLLDLAIARLTAAGQLDVSFGSSQVDSDVFPDDFSIPTVTVPWGSVNVESAPVTITGINAPTAFIGDELSVSIGCNGTWQTDVVLMRSGDAFCVRANGPATANASRTLSVNVGGRVSNFVIQSSADAPDTVPEAFTFPSLTNVAPGELVTSAPITVEGITGYTFIRVLAADGYFQLGCDGFNLSGQFDRIMNGDTICVSHYASTASATSTTTTVNIGGTIGTFTSTTEVVDLVPDPFAFLDQTGVALDTVVTSNTIAISGISRAPITITDGEYSIGCTGTFTSNAGMIANGATVCVRTRSGIAFEMTTSATLAIGEVQETFNVTTMAEDTIPDAFSFTAKMNVQPNTQVLSNTVVVSGINSPATISVTGGEYSVGCSAFTRTTGTVVNGQTVCLRHWSAGVAGTTRSTTLTIGGVTARFSSTTAVRSGSRGGGSIDLLFLCFAFSVMSLTVRERYRTRTARPFRRGFASRHCSHL